MVILCEYSLVFEQELASGSPKIIDSTRRSAQSVPDVSARVLIVVNLRGKFVYIKQVQVLHCEISILRISSVFVDVATQNQKEHIVTGHL